MFRPTLARLATHAPRKPSIHFPDRHAPHPSHAPAPHPYAPKEIIDAFPSFLAKLQASAKAKASGVPLSGPAGGDAKGKGFSSSLPEADFEGEWDMPVRFRRAVYAPAEAEIDAVLSGGATEAPVVSKAYKEKWYTAQV
ncbi:small subunit ribosomal protein YMR-31, partial [Phenoliferia sp. Uapishka_3]